MIDAQIHSELDLAMDVSTFTAGRKQAALALSESGEFYRGAGFVSQTHLLNIEAGAAALYAATQHGDYAIYEILLMSEARSDAINPVLAQSLIDFSRTSNREFQVSPV